MNAKHTPGQLKMRKCEDTTLYNVVDSHGALICTCNEESDARLFAAAPIMYTFIQNLAKKGSEEAASIIKEINA